MPTQAATFSFPRKAFTPTWASRALSACRFHGWLERPQIVVRFPQSTRKIAEQKTFLLEACRLRPGVPFPAWQALSGS